MTPCNPAEPASCQPHHSMVRPSQGWQVWQRVTGGHRCPACSEHVHPLWGAQRLSVGSALQFTLVHPAKSVINLCGASPLIPPQPWPPIQPTIHAEQGTSNAALYQPGIKSRKHNAVWIAFVAMHRQAGAGAMAIYCMAVICIAVRALHPKTVHTPLIMCHWPPQVTGIVGQMLGAQGGFQ